MAELEFNGLAVHYQVDGPEGGPAYVFVNGLTQYADLWQTYRAKLVAQGFRTVTFDLLGQGESDKPALFIDQDAQVAIAHTLIRRTCVPGVPVFLAGISFGGVIALRVAIDYPKLLTGLCIMSSFAEMSPQLTLIGAALRTGLINGGVSYLQDLLLPMNLSNEWLGPRMPQLETVKRPGWVINDLYALQNLMESFLDFRPLTADLPRIQVPTLILNGEFDFLTPRDLHEAMRVGIPDSALMLVPRGYHAFTLEMPDLTIALLARFAREVMGGTWHGKQSVWIASDTPEGAPQPFPEGFDHLRAIPVRLNGPTEPKAKDTAPVPRARKRGKR
jgi:3-oxoadipate enol-lactonase